MTQSWTKTDSVHILTPIVSSGDATGDHVLQLLAMLRHAGANVTALSSGRAEAPHRDLAAHVRHVDPAHYQATARLTILEYPHWYPLADQLRLTPGASLFWYHGVTPPRLWGSTAGQELLMLSEIRTRIAWYAHLAAVASPFMAQELHEHSGYPRERIRVVPLGVDIPRFAQKPASDELARLRQQWGLEQKQILLYVGRFAGNKRLDLLVSAVRELSAEYPNLHLLLVGDYASSDVATTNYQRVQQQVAEQGLTARVTCTGRVDSVIPYLHLGDIYVQASQHEGFCVPLIEAMAADLPVVASASGAMPWVLGYDEADEGRRAGLLFTPDDVGDLARQIRRLLHEPDLARKLRTQGRVRVQQFTEEHFQQRALDVMHAAVVMQHEAPPIRQYLPESFHPTADITNRGYRVLSRVPLLGSLIAWIRRNSTTHVKEAYLDPILERQVYHNRLLADEVERLAIDVHRLRQEIAQLRAEGNVNRTPKSSS